MKPKMALERLKKLLSAMSFTSKEAKANGVSSEMLAYYVRIGDIERLGRGLYRGIRAPTMINFQWEDLVVAVRNTTDGVICLTSALALYELTEEIPRQHWIAIRHGTRYQTNTSVKVVRMRNHTLGKTVMDIEGMAVPIFDKERTILDAFRYLSKETALKALRTGLQQPLAQRINIEKLRTYAKKMRVNIDPYLMAMTL